MLSTSYRANSADYLEVRIMLFTNVMKTLVLIGLFIAIPLAIINLSRRQINRLVQYLRSRPHRS
ncbi:MAG: hypothetical protein OEY52_16160 [Gammaproteobacteria bacterium]|nr:hypothetical protein [Gammaproteobacteria bacterium]